MRRFTRLTNGFSKKIENHAHGVAHHMMYYNFCPYSQDLADYPAMAAGVTDTLLSIDDIVKLVEASEEGAKKRGPY